MATRETTRLLDGLAFVESPRWHDDRLWFSHWGAEEIIAVDLDGTSEVVGRGPAGFGWATEWLPDGRMLLTGPELCGEEPDGTMVRHADLGDDRGRRLGRDRRRRQRQRLREQHQLRLHGRRAAVVAAGHRRLVTPDGAARRVVDGIAFPNGMVITPDGSTLILSESFTGRLLAFDIAPDGSLVEPSGVGRGHRARRHLPRRRGLHLDPRPADALGRASTRRRRDHRTHPGREGPVPRRCSAGPMARRSSSCSPSGPASRTPRSRSPSAPARCAWCTSTCPTPAAPSPPIGGRLAHSCQHREQLAVRERRTRSWRDSILPLLQSRPRDPHCRRRLFQRHPSR